MNLGKKRLMVSGIDEETPDSKADLCGVCGKRVMANLVLCTICCKWIHARCTKMKKVTACLTRDVKWNVTGGCEVAVTARTRIGMMKFRECGELLNSKRFSLKLQGKVYKKLCKICYDVWK